MCNASASSDQSSRSHGGSGTPSNASVRAAVQEREAALRQEFRLKCEVMREDFTQRTKDMKKDITLLRAMVMSEMVSPYSRVRITSRIPRTPMRYGPTG